MKKVIAFIIVGCVVALSLAPLFTRAAQTTGATLYVGPATGNFSVGSTFTLTFYVNTGNQFINVVDANILFPPDKLQVVSPSTGASFINVWAIQPSYSNTEGTMTFRGAVPSPGVNTSAGLISTVTFRVRAIGTAVVRFSDGSKVLLNDGLGTDILQQTQSGIYTLTLPPPAGPIVVSPTHPDQTRWYNSNAVQFSWAGDPGASGYSYMISQDPTDTPDNIRDTNTTGVTYHDLANGRHYFHIKALRDGVWGGVTHYALNIDTDPPAQFPLEILPSSRTAQHQPVIKFFTTDEHSGVDRYELNIIGLGRANAPGALNEEVDKGFFIEAQSPFIPTQLDFGRYDVYVRAYDTAGNYREVNRRLEVVPTIFEVIQGQGIQVGDIIFISWQVFWLLGLIVLIGLGIAARRLHWWHHSATSGQGGLPAHLNEKLVELKRYQEKYGKSLAAILLVLVSLTFFAAPAAQAQFAADVLPPPVITIASRDIFSDEIFYVGGQSTIAQGEVLFYIQRLQDGQTTSYRLTTDDKGAWFYRHEGFLQPGSYLLWVQATRGEELSPPSPQVTMNVAAHAIKLGSSRFSYEAVYFIAMLLLGAIVIILIIAIWYHYHHGRRKHAAFGVEKAKIEESIRRGFALLRRDIEEEAALLSRLKNGTGLTEEERRREEQILKDLEAVKRHIGEEVWELEKLEGGA